MRDSKQLQERKMKEERMQEVRLLLEHLVIREEIIIKLIIACLYDVGSVNIINRKVPQPFLNHPLKRVAGVSRPLFKVIGFRWLRRNCPDLITNWLYTKVSFPERVKPPVSSPKVVVAEQTALVEKQTALVESENLNREIRRLRGQVKLLSGISLGAIAALSGVLVWMNYRPEIGASHQVIQPSQSLSVGNSDPLP